jgi:hypothetical protein
VTAAAGQILRAAREEEFAIIAYCFMPEHLHMVVEGAAENSDLKTFISRAKQFSAYEHSQRAGKRLWQRYCFEHVIRIANRRSDRSRTFCRIRCGAGSSRNQRITLTSARACIRRENCWSLRLAVGYPKPRDESG